MPGDVAVGNLTNQLIGDCNFGLYWSGDRHFVGFSGYNLFENKTDLLALTTPVLNTLERVFYIHGGYNFKVGAIFELQPSMIIRTMNKNLRSDGW